MHSVYCSIQSLVSNKDESSLEEDDDEEELLLVVLLTFNVGNRRIAAVLTAILSRPAADVFVVLRRAAIDGATTQKTDKNPIVFANIFIL